MRDRPAIGATPRARALRKNPTDAETAMWRLLRESFPEAGVRRQVPILSFTADFASHRARLVIEVDGGQHGGPEDETRTALIEQEGYRVIRFWNHEVLGNPEGVWHRIAEALGTAPPLDGSAAAKAAPGGSSQAADGLGRGEVSGETPRCINATPTQPSPIKGEG